MTPIELNNLVNVTSPLPIARIDTFDETYILPLREYLFTNGCQIFVNSGPTENVTYHFIVGDWNFVKKILVYRHTVGEKNCIICWDTDIDEDFLSGVKTAKTVFVNPRSLTQKIITDIFSFLFTPSSKKILDLRTKQEGMLQPFPKTPPQSSEKTHSTPMENETLISEDKQRINTLIASLFDNKSSAKKKPIQRPRRSNRFHALTACLLIIFVFSLPFLLYGMSLIGQVLTLKSGISCLEKGDQSCVKRSLKIAKGWQTQTQLASNIVLPIASLIQGESGRKTQEQTQFLLATTSTVMEESLGLYANVDQLLASLFILSEDKKQNGNTPLVAVDAIKKSLPTIRTSVDLITATLQSLSQTQTFPFSQGVMQSLIRKTAHKVNSIKQSIETGERLLSIYPALAGYKKTQKILVLLQNSSELRPTGGFIGSLARIDITDGKIEMLRVEDVYTADGQLKGHIDPPPVLQDLMGLEHWYLRDSNWNPDFRESASTARWFYEKETGEKVDAVIGITTSFFVKFLNVTGPMDLPTYNDRITADNFYAKSYYYTQVDFFPGSTQKKDFLGSILQLVLEKLRTDGKTIGLPLLTVVNDAFASSDIQINLTDQESQCALVQYGWGGTVPNVNTCAFADEKTPCVFSYLYTNEANVSTSKVNVFIERNQEKTIRIDEQGNITCAITRRIKNNSSGKQNTGAYTVYTRFLIPQRATIETFMLDGKLVPNRDEQKKKQDLPFGVIEKGLPDITSIGIAFVVPQGEERLISLSYTLYDPLSFGVNGGKFVLFEQKQPGVDSVPTQTTLQYPSWWQLFPEENRGISGIIANPGVFKYNTSLSTNEEQSIVLYNHP